MDFPPGLYPPHQVGSDIAYRPTAPARLRTHLKPLPVAVRRQLSEGTVGNPIPKKGKEFVPQIGERVAAYYRRVYPKNTAKHLANEAGCSIDTAKNWITGSCPANEHLFAMWSRHGDSFFAFVFAPVAPSLAKMAELAEETNSIQARIRKLHEALGDE